MGRQASARLCSIPVSRNLPIHHPLERLCISSPGIWVGYLDRIDRKHVAYHPGFNDLCGWDVPVRSASVHQPGDTSSCRGCGAARDLLLRIHPPFLP